MECHFLEVMSLPINMFTRIMTFTDCEMRHDSMWYFVGVNTEAKALGSPRSPTTSAVSRRLANPINGSTKFLYGT